MVGPPTLALIRFMSFAANTSPLTGSLKVTTALFFVQGPANRLQ
jgi:hypothetical protein